MGRFGHIKILRAVLVGAVLVHGPFLDLEVTEVSKIDSTWDKSDSKSTSSRLRESLELKLKLD